ncbi:hypothetical protein E2C01_094242 [Portunus trituberculatus]|uniref:Uncharacterized protein n=1 Tax=Portunus trituberculatus TaxID=210409 RepID=A0A5B7JX28_PORTR|nr:hypothetical protein [Portunus trituberculatus]
MFSDPRILWCGVAGVGLLPFTLTMQMSSRQSAPGLATRLELNLLEFRVTCGVSGKKPKMMNRWRQKKHKQQQQVHVHIPNHEDPTAGTCILCAETEYVLIYHAPARSSK